MLNNYLWAAIQKFFATVQKYRAITELNDCLRSVAYEEDGSTSLSNLFYARETFSLKRLISNCQRFINNKDVWINVNCNCKSQPHVHARGISLHRLFYELTYISESNDLIIPRKRFLVGQTENSRVQEDVLATSKIRIES